METQNADIFTVAEAAEFLRIPRSSVYKLAQEGKIPARKVGRHWRFYRPTLLNWIAGQVSMEDNLNKNLVEPLFLTRNSPPEGSSMQPGSFPLPEILRPLFWDVDFASLHWETDRDLIVRRILRSGSWSAIRWLRLSWTDQALRAWLEAHAGSRLSPRQLRYWELILDLPAHEVEIWISRSSDNPWERRVAR